MDFRIILACFVSLAVLFSGCSVPQQQNYPLDAEPQYGDLPANYGKIINQQFAVAECDKMDVIENHDQCYIEKARATGEISYCINLWERNDECYTAIAYDKKDSSICANVKSSDPHDMCLLEFSKKDFSLCSKMILPSFRDTCFADAFSATKDKTYCNSISDETKKKNCSETPMTQSEADIQSCNLLSTTQEKELCLAIAAGASGDIAVCNGITTQQTKESCFTAVGLQTKQKKYCDMVTDQATRDMCYQNLAIIAKDPAICDSMQQIPQVIDACKQQVAIAGQ